MVPGYKHVRDVIEHFDKYEMGDGNLQQRKQAKRRNVPPGEPRLPDEIIVWAGKDVDGVFRLHVADALELDFGLAQGAAEVLRYNVASALNFTSTGC